MSISAEELATIVEAASHRAAACEQDAAARAAAAIRAAKIGADAQSEGSRFLRSLVETAGGCLSEATRARLRTVEIFGVETQYANAIPDGAGGKRRIFVFEGLQQLTVYYADLIRVLDGLQRLRPDAQVMLNGQMLPEALAFSMAGFSVLSHAMSTQTLPVPIHDMLGPVARKDLYYGYRLAMTFVLLHELGHIDLGHLSLTGVRSERHHVDLLESEELSSFQMDELAADAFAFEALPVDLRGEFMPSVMFLMGGNAFMEAFSGNLSPHHPLSLNRLNALADLSPMADADKSAVRSWLESQVTGWRRLGNCQDQARVNLRSRIEERIPAATASRLMLAIKERVLAEHGEMDFAH